MGEILEILDKGQILTDIEAVIVEIAKLEGAITKASNTLLTVKVELYGAESLQDVLEGTNAIRKAMVDLGIVQKQNADLVANLNENYGMLGKSFDQALEDYAQLKIQLTVLNDKIAQQNALLLKGGVDAEKAAAALEPLIQQQRKLGIEVTNANNIINKSIDERVAKEQAAAEKSRIAEIDKTNVLKVEGEKRIAAINKEQQQKEKAYQQEEAREIKRVQQATTAAQKIVDANSAIYNSVSGLRAKMVELQLAGEGLSQEYLILAERANALTVANQKVNNAVANPAGLAAHIQSTNGTGAAEASTSALSAEDAALARINARIEQSVAEENALADAKYKDLAITEQLNTANVNSNRIAKNSGEQIQILQSNLAGLQSEQAKHKQGTAVWKQYETAIVNTKGQLQKLGVETENLAPKVEKTAGAFKIMGVNVEAMMARLILRTVAYTFIIQGVISFFENLGNMILGTSERFMKAKESTAAYNIELQQVGNTINDVVEKERMLNDILLETAKNTSVSFDKRTDSINKYRSAYGHLLDMYSDEQVANKQTGGEIDNKIKKADELNKVQLDAQKRLEERLKQNSELNKKIVEEQAKLDNTNVFIHPFVFNDTKKALATYKGQQDDLFRDTRGLYPKGDKRGNQSIGQLTEDFEKKNQEYLQFTNNSKDIGLIPVLEGQIAQLESQLKRRKYDKYGITDKTTAEQIRKMKKDIDTDPEFVQPIKDIQQKKDELAELMGKKNPKGRTKKDNAKGLEAELRDEEERYKLELQKYKEMYLAKDNTFEEARIVHQKELYKQEEGAAANHADFMNTIIAKKEYQFVDSKFARAARLKKVQEEKVRAENDLTGKEKEAALEKAKIEEDLIKKEEEAYQHYKEHADKMLKLDRELEEMKEKGAYNKKYANGISPFLEGLGFDGSFKQKNDELDIQIASKKKQLEDIKKQEDEQLHGTLNNHTVDPKKVYKLAEDKKQTENDITQLEDDKQKAIDEKKIQAKKEVAEKAIELAKTTWDAIKQIQEQQFAWEQKQLDIEQRNVELHSEQEMRAIDAKTEFAIQKDNEKALVAAQTAAKENELQQKRNNLELKKAIADKQMAEAQILMNTAAAEMKVIASSVEIGPEGLAIGIAEAAIVAAIGAAQYAAASSTPLPQFEDGGVTATSHFIAAEGNKPELIIAPSGDVSIASKEGVYTAPIGSTVKNASDTEKLLKYAINGIGINGMSMGMLMEQRTKQMTDKRIVEELQDVKAEIIRSAYIGRVINNNVVIKGNDLQRPTRN